MRFLFTILLVLGITGFVSWLNWRLLSRIFAITSSRIIKFSYLFFSVITILIMGYGWTKRPPFVIPEIEVFRILVYVALSWLIGQLILLCMQPLVYVIHRWILGSKSAAKPEEIESTTMMTRRVFLHNAMGFTPLIAFGISTKGIYGAQTDMVVQQHLLSIPGLPDDLKGFKIAQVSDCHLGPYFDLAKLEKAIDLLRAERPDLVAITGDFADDLSLLRPAIDRLNDLQPSIPNGIYFCMGNHDYFRNSNYVRTELNKSRIVPMDNVNKLIVQGRKPFYLIGVDYPWEDNTHTGINVSARRREQFFATAHQDIPPDTFRVLIGHHPDILFDGFKAGIPLTLAGHTHGGQVVIGGKSILHSYQYMRGLYRENGVYGYVNSGVGHWFPFRFGCPPEISVFILQ